MSSSSSDCCCCSCFVIVFIAILVLYKWLDNLLRRQRIGALDTRHIFITGCDTGFGNLISKRLDSLGCHVIAGCLTEQGEEELKKSCSSRLKTVRLNVASHDSVTKAYDTVKTLLPAGKGLWGIINNAGISGSKNGMAEWLTLQDYKEVLSVNLFGVVDVATTFLPLIRSERGRIVNTASIMGRYSLPGIAPYNISKYGVEAFSDTIRRELRVFGVSVHLIEPGFFKTNICRGDAIYNGIQAAWNQTPEHVKKDYGEEFFKAVRDITPSKITSSLVSDKLSDVIDTYEHALLARFPRARYVVGKDAKYFFLPMQWMPEWLGDWIMHLQSPLPRPSSVR